MTLNLNWNLKQLINMKLELQLELEFDTFSWKWILPGAWTEICFLQKFSMLYTCLLIFSFFLELNFFVILIYNLFTNYGICNLHTTCKSMLALLPCILVAMYVYATHKGITARDLLILPCLISLQCGNLWLRVIFKVEKVIGSKQSSLFRVIFSEKIQKPHFFFFKNLLLFCC